MLISSGHKPDPLAWPEFGCIQEPASGDLDRRWTHGAVGEGGGLQQSRHRDQEAVMVRSSWKVA